MVYVDIIYCHRPVHFKAIDHFKAVPPLWCTPPIKWSSFKLKHLGWNNETLRQSRIFGIWIPIFPRFSSQAKNATQSDLVVYILSSWLKNKGWYCIEPWCPEVHWKCHQKHSRTPVKFIHIEAPRGGGKFSTLLQIQGYGLGSTCCEASDPNNKIQLGSGWLEAYSVRDNFKTLNIARNHRVMNSTRNAPEKMTLSDTTFTRDSLALNHGVRNSTANVPNRDAPGHSFRTY